MKVIEVSDAKGMFVFDCPACGCSHHINTNPQYGAVWQFNFDLDKPTASPSLLVRYPKVDKQIVCHSFVRDGRIQYLNDCTHDLAGQTIELPDIA